MTEKDDDPCTWFPCTCIPYVVNQKDGATVKELDPVAGECMKHGAKDCPHGEPLHFHHDGCPVCTKEGYLRELSREQTVALAHRMKAGAREIRKAADVEPFTGDAAEFMRRVEERAERARKSDELVRMASRAAASRMGSIEASLETDGGALAKGVLRLLLTDDKDGAMGMLGAVFMRTLQFDEDGQMKPGKTKVTEEDLVDALKDLVKEPH